MTQSQHLENSGKRIVTTSKQFGLHRYLQVSQGSKMKCYSQDNEQKKEEEEEEEGGRVGEGEIKEEEDKEEETINPGLNPQRLILFVPCSALCLSLLGL